jgi:hypothetical protein
MVVSRQERRERLIALIRERNEERAALHALSCLILPPLPGEPPAQAEFRRKAEDIKKRIEDLEGEIRKLSGEE